MGGNDTIGHSKPAWQPVARLTFTVKQAKQQIATKEDLGNLMGG